MTPRRARLWCEVLAEQEFPGDGGEWAPQYKGFPGNRIALPTAELDILKDMEYWARLGNITQRGVALTEKKESCMANRKCKSYLHGKEIRFETRKAVVVPISCGKRVYRNRKECLTAANNTTAKLGKQYYAYKCRLCGDWHTTTQEPRQWRAQRTGEPIE